MAKYNSSAKFKVTGSYDVQSDSPLDVRIVVDNRIDLVRNNTFKVAAAEGYIYEGIVVYVCESKSLYIQTFDAEHFAWYDGQDYSITDDELFADYGWKKLETNGVDIDWKVDIGESESEDSDDSNY